MLEAVFSVDRAILLFVQDNLRCPLLNAVMVFFTTLGNFGALWLALGLIFLFFKKTRRAGFDLLLSVAVCWLISEPLVKNLVQRPRPFLLIPELSTLVPKPSSFSFPSGHACSSLAAACALRWSFGKKGGWFFVPALLVALSRIYVGVHYPSDVPVGGLWGFFGALLLCFLSRKYIHWPFLDGGTARNKY